MNVNNQIKTILFAALSGIGIGIVWADGLNIKPGLWQIKQQTNVNGQQMPDMKDMMAKVPPEMREQMKAMMAKSGAGMNDAGLTICVTPEQIARGDYGNQDSKSNCKMTDVKHNGNITSMKMHCDAPHQADGTTEVTRISDTEWQSTTQMTTEKGNIDNKSTGKWLASDCGDVKPFAEVKPFVKK